MKITLYRTLSNVSETVEIESEKAINEQITDIDFDNSVILANSKEVFSDYKPNENDIILIRQFPGWNPFKSAANKVKNVVKKVGNAISDSIQGAWNTVDAVIALASPTNMILWCIGKAGGYLYKIQKQLSAVSDSVDDLKNSTGSDEVDNRPFIKGASNSKATSKSMPYICGKHLFTPYLLGSQFYKLSGTDGKDQFVYIPLEGGFSNQYVSKIFADDVLIYSNETKSVWSGKFSLLDKTFFDGSYGYLVQNGSFTDDFEELNYKHVMTNASTEIPRSTDVASGDESELVYTLDENAMDVRVAVSFPNGLYKYDDDNNKQVTNVNIRCYFSVDGGTTWSLYYNSTFSKNTLDEIRYEIPLSFGKSTIDTAKANDQAIRIKVTREGDVANTDNKINDKAYVLYYQSVCFDATLYKQGTLEKCKILEDKERNQSVMLGLMIKANDLNADKLGKISVITSGVARTWNGSEWSAEKTVTSNPASWILEILTSDTHPLSKFLDSELDLTSFGEFYEYCDDKGFEFNYVVNQGTKKIDLIETIVENFGAVLYKDQISGLWCVAIDKANDTPIAVYNSQNIISIQNSKTFGRRTDALKVTYVSSENDSFAEEVYTVMRNGVTELGLESVIKEVTLTGITEFDNVVWHARRIMAIESLRPKTTVIEIGKEGIFYHPLQKILLQDDSLKIGLSSGVISTVTIENNAVTKLISNSTVNFESGKSYGIIVDCFVGDSKKQLSLEVTGNGETNVLELKHPISIGSTVMPESGDIFSFGELENGEFTKITTPYLISTIARTESGYSLGLVNYNEAIYDTGDIPDYVSNITQKPAVSNVAIPKYITRNDLLESVATIPKGERGESGLDGQDGLTLYLSNPTGSVYTDADGVPYSTSITTSVKCFYNDVELFLPIVSVDGAKNFNFTIEGSTVTFTPMSNAVYQDTTTVALYFKFGISAFFADKTYALAVDSTLEDILATISGEYGNVLYFNLIPKKVGSYLGSKTELPDTSTLQLGDYFVANEIEGYKTSVIYAWNGTEFVEKSCHDYESIAFTDIIGTANDLLSQNNSDVSEMLNQLVSNRIFVQRLVAVTAFINTLFSKNITLQDGGSIKSSNYESGSSGFKISHDGSAEFNNVTIGGGKAKTAIDNAQTSADTANTSITNLKSSLKDLAYEDLVETEKLGATVISSDGYLQTDLINVDELFAKNITMKNNGTIQSSNYVSGSSGFKIEANGKAEFGSLKINNTGSAEFNSRTTFTNITASGSVTASGGVITPSVKNSSGYITVANPYVTGTIKRNAGVKTVIDSASPSNLFYGNTFTFAKISSVLKDPYNTSNRNISAYCTGEFIVHYNYEYSDDTGIHKEDEYIHYTPFLVSYKNSTTLVFYCFATNGYTTATLDNNNKWGGAIEEYSYLEEYNEVSCSSLYIY